MAVELESAKRLNALIAKANAATGGDDTTVTDAVDTLIAGFGQGGGGSGTELIQRIASMQNLFKGVDLSGTPDIDISLINVPLTTQGAFQNAKGIDTITLSCPEGGTVHWGGMFHGCSVRVIDLTGFHAKPVSVASAFICSNLTEIRGELDFSSCTNVTNAFGVYTNLIPLQEVRFKPGTIAVDMSGSRIGNADKLSDASIQSIIDGLADLTSGTAQTLTLHADVKSKLTETQISTITGKNWTLA